MQAALENYPALSGQLAATAGSLLLNEPDLALTARLGQAGYQVGEIGRLRQQFYDRLGIPQSGLYLPPYEHVFRRREEGDGVWYFPAARHDGAEKVEAVYRALGFRREAIPVGSLFASANIPGDHLGLMLMFAGSALQGIAAGDVTNREFIVTISNFIDQHLGNWADAFCSSLPLVDTDGYLVALADAVQEALDSLRNWRQTRAVCEMPEAGLE